MYKIFRKLKDWITGYNREKEIKWMIGVASYNQRELKLESKEDWKIYCELDDLILSLEAEIYPEKAIEWERRKWEKERRYYEEMETEYYRL